MSCILLVCAIDAIGAVGAIGSICGRDISNIFGRFKRTTFRLWVDPD